VIEITGLNLVLLVMNAVEKISYITFSKYDFTDKGLYLR